MTSQTPELASNFTASRDHSVSSSTSSAFYGKTSRAPSPYVSTNPWRHTLDSTDSPSLQVCRQKFASLSGSVDTASRHWPPSTTHAASLVDSAPSRLQGPAFPYVAIHMYGPCTTSNFYYEHDAQHAAPLISSTPCNIFVILSRRSP